MNRHPVHPNPRFYIPVPESDHEVAGPYDLVQMAGLLRKKIITAQTLTYVEGEEDWEPFGRRPQFLVAKEMPLDAISMNQEARNAEDMEAKSYLPVPSPELIVKVVGTVLFLLLAGGISYFVARADETAGICLAAIGAGVALIGQCMIYVRLMDEDFLTILLVVFVPFYDIFYFIANFWDYLPYFCAKYLGSIVATAALAGIACGDSSAASQIQSILHFYGQ